MVTLVLTISPNVHYLKIIEKKAFRQFSVEKHWKQSDEWNL